MRSILKTTTCASIAYSRLSSSDYPSLYTFEFDKELKALDAKCPQGSGSFVMNRHGDYKSRYDGFGSNQTMFIAKEEANDKCIAFGSAVSTNFVIDQQSNREYKEVYFLDLRVDPNHRRKGIGSSINELQYEWAKNNENAQIVTFSIDKTNISSQLMHERCLDSYFIHPFTFYKVDTTQIDKEIADNVSVETIANQMEFLRNNIPKHFVLYPNDNSLDMLTNHIPFKNTYIAKKGNEWMSVSLYDQSLIYHMESERTKMKFVYLTAVMSMCNDEETESILFRKLIHRIHEEYPDRILFVPTSKQFSKKEYGDILKPAMECLEYYVGIDDETNGEIMNVIENADGKTKTVWVDPRKL